MRISDWSSDVCSSDLLGALSVLSLAGFSQSFRPRRALPRKRFAALLQTWGTAARRHPVGGLGSIGEMLIEHNHGFGRSEEHTSELQSLMRTSYAVFCLKKHK